MSKTYRIHHADGSPENLVDKIGAHVVIEKDEKKRLVKIKHGKRIITDAISSKDLRQISQVFICSASHSSHV